MTTKHVIKQSVFQNLPGKVFGYWLSSPTINSFKLGTHRLEDYEVGSVGIQPASPEKYVHFWWEINHRDISFGAKTVHDTYCGQKWFLYNKGGSFRKWSGNNDTVIDWLNDGEDIKKESEVTGKHYQQYSDSLKFQPFITWSRVSTGDPAFRLRTGSYLSDMAGFSLYSKGKENQLVILAFCNSVVAKHFLSFLSPGMNFMLGPVLNLPIQESMFKVETLSILVDELLLASQKEWDSFETSWGFKRHPLM